MHRYDAMRMCDKLVLVTRGNDQCEMEKWLWFVGHAVMSDKVQQNRTDEARFVAYRREARVRVNVAFPTYFHDYMHL